MIAPAHSSALNLEDTFQNRQAMRNGAPRPTGLFSGSRSTSHPPIPPQKPDQGVPRHLLEQIAEEDPGEVLVGVNTDLESHISRANRLLDVRLQQGYADNRTNPFSLSSFGPANLRLLCVLQRYLSVFSGSATATCYLSYTDMSLRRKSLSPRDRVSSSLTNDRRSCSGTRLTIGERRKSGLLHPAWPSTFPESSCPI